MKSIRVLSWTVFAASIATSHADTLATFDDLPNGPTPASPAFHLNSAVNPPVAGNATYDGVVWDSRLYVADVSYSLSVGAPNFGASHSGSTYLTTADDNISVVTSMVLTSAWFGRATFYGFGGGTDQVTVDALHGTTVLGSVTLDLPLTNPGHTEPLVQMDTSSFLGLSGITGYEIDRHETDPTYGANNWIGDDFNFIAAPEPGSATLVTALVLGIGVGLRRMKCRRS